MGGERRIYTQGIKVSHLHVSQRLVLEFVEKFHHLINHCIPLDAPHPVCIVLNFSYISDCNRFSGSRLMIASNEA